MMLAAPTLIGRLDGLPPKARVAANAVAAADELKDLRVTYDKAKEAIDESAKWTEVEPEDSPILERWMDQISYLEAVVAGDIQLYLYDPSKDSIIEMIGDPDDATRVLSYVPGTNAAMQDFYSGYDPDRADGEPSDSITGFARWQVENAEEEKSVVAFVFKDGTFPNVTTPFLADGPQNNHYADELGLSYARFLAGLDSTDLASVPMVSAEHSFGTAVAGVAEVHGSTFDARILLAGIGMQNGWTPNPETTYSAFQAPDDLNRALTGIEFTWWGGGIGYGITPTPSNGITPYATGIEPALGLTERIVLASGNLTAAAMTDLVSSYDNHNQIVSDDEEKNRRVLTAVRRLIAGVRG
jgi:hypothetical protein